MGQTRQRTQEQVPDKEDEIKQETEDRDPKPVFMLVAAFSWSRPVGFVAAPILRRPFWSGHGCLLFSFLFPVSM